MEFRFQLPYYHQCMKLEGDTFLGILRTSIIKSMGEIPKTWYKPLPQSRCHLVCLSIPGPSLYFLSLSLEMLWSPSHLFNQWLTQYSDIDFFCFTVNTQHETTTYICVSQRVQNLRNTYQMWWPWLQWWNYPNVNTNLWTQLQKMAITSHQHTWNDTVNMFSSPVHFS